MIWQHKIFLTALIFIPLLFVLFLFTERRKSLYLRRKVRPEGLLAVSDRKITVKRILFIFAAAFLVLALSGPRWGRKWQEVKKPGIDVIMVIDTSASMQAGDIMPSRMSAAKDKVKFLVSNIKNARMGLVFFAGTSFLQCPVTFDRQALNLFLNEAWNNLIPLPGSNIEKALKLAEDSFPPSAGISDKYIVLVTDGEELQGDAQKAVEELEKAGIKVISLGIGTEEGAPIPVYSNGSLQGYKKNASGETVMSCLDPSLLKIIAEKTGGVCVSYTDDMSDVSRVIDIIEKGKQQEKSDKVRIDTEYRYQYPLLAALILLFAEFIISERKRGM